MTLTPTVKDVNDTFKNIVRENNRTIDELKNEEDETEQARQIQNTEYKSRLENFIASSVDNVHILALDAFSAATGGKADFHTEYKTQIAASRTAAYSLGILEQQHGAKATLEQRMVGLEQEAYLLSEGSAKIKERMRMRGHHLRDVAAFNDRADREHRPKLDAEDIGGFERKSLFSHIASWILDGHYRRGRALINRFAKFGATIPEAATAQEKDLGDLATADRRHGKVKADITGLAPTLESMRTFIRRIVPDGQIKAGISARIAGVMDSKAAFDTVALEMGDAFPVSLAESRAKTEVLRKISTGLKRHRESIDKANKPLASQLPSLEKAIRYGKGSQRTKKPVDLGAIDTHFLNRRAAAGNALRQMRRMRRSVVAFTTPAAREIMPATPKVKTLRVQKFRDQQRKVHGYAHTPANDGSSITDSYTDLMIYDMMLGDNTGVSHAFAGAGGGFGGAGSSGSFDEADAAAIHSILSFDDSAPAPDFGNGLTGGFNTEAAVPVDMGSVDAGAAVSVDCGVSADAGVGGAEASCGASSCGSGSCGGGGD